MVFIYWKYIETKNAIKKTTLECNEPNKCESPTRRMSLQYIPWEKGVKFCFEKPDFDFFFKINLE